MNPLYVGWHSHKIDQVTNGFRNSQSRIGSHWSIRSFTSKSGEAGERLSKLVWEKYHPRDDHTKSNNRITNSSSTAFGSTTESSRQQGSYERELINRRLNILGDDFVDVGNNPSTPTPIQVTVSLASSDLPGSEISSDESTTEIEIPIQTRRNFVSLRGLSSSLSLSKQPFGNSEFSAHTKSSEPAIDLLENDHHASFFITNDRNIQTPADVRSLTEVSLQLWYDNIQW